jgi:hypothetical protein
MKRMFPKSYANLEERMNLTGQKEDIIQIKGKQNAAPVSKYLPHVQDFVKSGNWDRVRDISNTGLVDLNTRPKLMKSHGNRFATDEELKNLLDAYPDLQPPPGYATGGSVVRSRFAAALAAKR